MSRISKAMLQMRPIKRQ